MDSKFEPLEPETGAAVRAQGQKLFVPINGLICCVRWLFYLLCFLVGLVGVLIGVFVPSWEIGGPFVTAAVIGVMVMVVINRELADMIHTLEIIRDMLERGLAPTDWSVATVSKFTALFGEERWQALQSSPANWQEEVGKAVFAYIMKQVAAHISLYFYGPAALVGGLGLALLGVGAAVNIGDGKESVFIICYTVGGVLLGVGLCGALFTLCFVPAIIKPIIFQLTKIIKSSSDV